MKNLYERLKEYSETNSYAFHMPGHKRRTVVEAELPYGIDITEIGDFDDLHHASGVLKTAMERAANVYHAEETRFLINGSTVGILSAIMGSTEKGDKILVARNCHKSVYHAIFMQELEPIYLYPTYQENTQMNAGINPEDVEESLQRHTDIRAVVIVSPTYDGVVSDVAEIAKITHKRKIPLIVDEAHGAHFGFHPYFPKNANQVGADIVVHSLHKTLPSLTQTALLHMNGTIANRERVRHYLQMLQSSSPSYILMASIDVCVEFLENESTEIFENYVKQLQKTRMQLKEFKNLQLLETSWYDYSKIAIGVNHANINGKDLYTRLEKEFQLQLEMAAETYVIGITSLADTKEGHERLINALKEIDSSLSYKECVASIGKLPEAKHVKSHGSRRKSLKRRDSIGKVSAEMAYLYPPGIPVIAEGERISREAILYLERHEEMGFEIEGLKNKEQIEVWING